MTDESGRTTPIPDGRFEAEPRGSLEPNDPAAADDERLFVLLNRYVDLLHSDDVPSRSTLFVMHPELRELLAALESLDHLAPPPDAPRARRVPLDEIPETILGAERPAVVPAPDEPPRREFGKFTLFEEVGRGGMGVVYRAEQTDLGRTVAVKMILASQFASHDDVRRFYAEAKAAGSLRHPNIIGIHEVGHVDGQHYFAMDYVEGESLASVVRGGPIDPDKAAECLVATARAVQYLHEHGIIHRDLKPSNIIVDACGVPYVTDFGLAKVQSEGVRQTRTGTILGTPSYMSPEQAAGKLDEVSERSDVYSLGAILYELLTGRPPFKRNNDLDTLVDVLEGEPTLLSKLNPRIPRELEHICLRCLEKDPRRRYASAAELADDLERYLRREAVVAKPNGLWPRFRRWVRREPALASRLGVHLAAFSVVQIKYMINGYDLPYHLQVVSVFAIWVIVAFIFQRLMNRAELADFMKFSWSAADAVLLTIMLCIVEGPLGPLLIGYPVLVVASGLFFRVRLVWFMTATCLVSYLALAWIRQDREEPHYIAIFAAALAGLGAMVAYQVFRVRVLSRYYEQRKLT